MKSTVRTRRRPVPDPNDVLLAKSDVQRLANLSRRLIQVIAAILAAGFAFLILGPEKVVDFLKSTDDTAGLKIGLFLYYTSWVFGAKFDVDIEERVYAGDSLRGVLDWKTIGVLSVFTLVMMLFFFLHKRPQFFGLGLILFVLINVLGWKAVCWRVRSTIEESEAFFTEVRDYFGLEKLRAVADYIRGDWQKRRFVAMMVLAVLLTIISNAAFYSPVGLPRFDYFGFSDDLLRRHVASGFFLFYVVAAEGWMWLMRMNVYHHVNVLDDLAENFRLEPKPPKKTG